MLTKAGLKRRDGIVMHMARLRGIPVMSHIGMTPQMVQVFGGFKTQGQAEDQWPAIEADAQAVAGAGAFAVVLEAIVRRDGTVDIQRIVRSLGFGLDENAIQALKQWRFRPGMRNGVPVDVSLNIEVNFNLR